MTKPNTQNFTHANTNHAATVGSDAVRSRSMQFASAPVGLGLCLLGLVTRFCVLVAPEAFASLMPVL